MVKTVIKKYLMIHLQKDNFQLNNRTAEKFTQEDDKAEKERDKYKKK